MIPPTYQELADALADLLATEICLCLLIENEGQKCRVCTYREMIAQIKGA